MKFFLVINQPPKSCKAIEKVTIKGLWGTSWLHREENAGNDPLYVLLPNGKP